MIVQFTETWDGHNPDAKRMIADQYESLKRADPETQHIGRFMTIVMTAARTTFTPREVRHRGTIADEPDNQGMHQQRY